MQDEQSVDKMRRRIQESLIESQQEQLREQYGMQFQYMSDELSPESKIEWQDYLLEFERQFENAQTITVRERIGNPALPPLAEIPAAALEETINNLLDLLAEHSIVIDFLGEWDDQMAYRFITEELLDEQMDDIHIDGMFTHFEAATPAYDVQMWVEHFVRDVFWQERKYFLSGLEKRPLYNSKGEPVTPVEFTQELEAVWALLPAETRVNVQPLVTQVGEDEGEVTAVISWLHHHQPYQVESTFRLRPSPYGGWDVVQTSLLADLLTALNQ